MRSNTIIEEIVERELKSLCGTCVHKGECKYYRASAKAIIQCELFERGEDNHVNSLSKVGLCKMCDHADHCSLPGRKNGVWRCTEFN
jgi:hypothetical protein